MLRATYGDLCCAQNYVASTLAGALSPAQLDSGLRAAQHNRTPPIDARSLPYPTSREASAGVGKPSRRGAVDFVIPLCGGALKQTSPHGGNRSVAATKRSYDSQWSRRRLPGAAPNMLSDVGTDLPLSRETAVSKAAAQHSSWGNIGRQCRRGPPRRSGTNAIVRPARLCAVQVSVRARPDHRLLDPGILDAARPGSL